MDLPYKAEYAKSSRSSCRGCKSTIEKDSLRLAVMIQSAMFDGKQPNWFHFLCFFNKQRPKAADDFECFQSLKWEDQEKIKSKIVSGATDIVPAGKGKKRNAATAASNKAALKDFILEYSKSGRAMCRGCQQKILKNEIRISKKDFETDVGKRYGGQDMWHHLTCFAQLRTELGFFVCGDELPGYKSLKKEDQQELKKQLPSVKQEEIPVKKLKVEDEVDGVDEANKVDERKMRSQNKMIFALRDKLKVVNKKDLQLLLEDNEQQVSGGIDKLLDHIADGIIFGALKPCKTCKNGQLVFSSAGYSCEGDLTEWTKCSIITKEPDRSKFVISSELKEKYDFLNRCKRAGESRIIKTIKPTVSIKKEEEDTVDAKPKVQRTLPPLYDMQFVILGKGEIKNTLKTSITKMGGKVITKIGSSIMAVIGSVEEVEKMGARVMEAKDVDVHVVSHDFLDEAPNYCGKIPELIQIKSICTWGSDANLRLPQEATTSKSKSRSMFQKSGPSKITMKLKSGGAVDPDSGLEDQAHVYQKGNDKYTAILSVTDIQKQLNKYYKLQLLESDGAKRYWIFRSWGRIGTTIGNKKVESKRSLFEAIDEFKNLYEEKTGNSWDNRHNFVKVPNCYYPVDVDYGDDAAEKLNIDTTISSKLDKRIQDLITFIFDVDIMKKVMLEFELDTEKMPLGKLSKKQLQGAYKVLNELQTLVETQGSEAHFIDASNRFFTFVPHSFGTKTPPVINDLDTIKKKIEMVDNLMEMEIAYNMMKATSTDDGKSSIDNHYAQLKTDIEVLDQSSEEFLIIKDYVKNTHATTHSNYKLTIEEVYVIKRHGEEKRYKPFKKLPNRKLLWHGSRRTNYAGILSQGLRIAPPEAPVTGYMFGKGVYFADMVSKSANYCCTSSGNNLGLMLLSEVALGEMEELYQAKYIEKLPKGKHSVKGVGRTEPDPKVFKTLNGDVQVPLGKGVQLTTPKPTSLLYNEFIVYDVAQVKMKYLLKMNFKYKY